jgi:excisionase family DNA binding protein
MPHFTCPRCRSRELLTTPEAAEVLGVSEMTFYRLRYRRLLKKTKVGRGTRWRRSELIAHMDRFTRKSR